MRLPLRMALSHHAGAAAIDQSLELGAGNDSLISRTPSLIMSIRNGLGVVRLRAANLDEDCAHGVIKASDCPTFKSHDSRWVNDPDYYPKRRATRHHCRRKNADSVHNLRGCCTSDTVTR